MACILTRQLTILGNKLHYFNFEEIWKQENKRQDMFKKRRQELQTWIINKDKSR